ncbi:MAG: hypothetical protein LAO79_10290 [Acidobacteriia bacterium]|nr:hypothetical protein [Terriglobia bacterium]
MSDTPPPPGQMYLYDNITPPLLDGSYRFNVSTDTTIDGTDQNLPGATNYFNVEGPRFTLTPSLVAGVFPPRNGHGSFQENVPHIALSRRTLPWERALDPSGLIGTPTVKQGDPPRPVGPAPWLALLLFEEGEYTILQNQKLEDVVPSAVYKRLGSPPNINCDAVKTTHSVLSGIMPSLDELTVLSHVRQVNKDDRELSAGSSDGWFSVVMSNRVAAPNSKCCACLVSLEERSDLVPKDPPADFIPILVEPGPIVLHPLAATNFSAQSRTPIVFPKEPFPFQITVSLVLLYSWKFECIGPGSFRDLMQGLDVAMFGTVADPGHPPVADTGHIKIALGDRAGVDETVLYRSPLAPFQLTRDPLGPYHSADQCRRVAPETGAEDITYACAFEVGRLLAAADARLAQELMRWRREGYRQSARADTFSAVSETLPLVQAIDVHTPAIPVVAAGATTSMLTGRGPAADRFGVDYLNQVIGLQPAALQDAWQLSSAAEAAAILGADAGTLGATVTAPAATPRAATTIDAVAANSSALTNLNAARDRIIANTAQKVGTP